MGKIHFGEVLAQFLQDAGLSHEHLYDWIAKSETISSLEAKGKAISPSGVKERIRVARANERHAHEFPYIADIIHYFEHRGEIEFADRLRHIVATQQRDLGINYTNFGPQGESELSRVSWLRFPPKHPISRYTLNEWLFALMDGDYNLHRASVITFEHLKNSYTHAPIRKLIALDLVTSAISHGDFVDAYLICYGYEKAWEEATVCHSNGRTAGVDPFNEDEVVQYVLSLIYKAVAFSHIFFWKPVGTSRALFDEALKKLRVFKRNNLLKTSIYRRLRTFVHVQYGRVVCRSLIGAYHEFIESDESMVSLLLEVKRLSRWLESAPDKSVDYFTAWDTVARLASLIAGKNGLDRESLIDETIQIQQYALKKAKDYQDQQDAFESGYRKGLPSRIRAYRSCATTIVSICTLKRLGWLDEHTVRERLKFQIDRFLMIVGPDKLRHSKYLLFSLERMIGQILDSEKNNYSLLEPSISADAEQSVLNEFSRKAKAIGELYFKVDPLDIVQMLTLREANCYNRDRK